MNTPKISIETREQLIKEIAIILTKAVANDPSSMTGGIHNVLRANPVIIAEMIVDGKPKSEIVEFIRNDNEYDDNTGTLHTPYITDKSQIETIQTTDTKQPYLTDVPYDSDLLK